MKSVGDNLFVFQGNGTPDMGYERCLAKDLNLDEAWLRDAIFARPDLVIGPCRAAGLTDDDWYPWRREFVVETGRIDVLLLSSQGRVAVVETKLAHNPELRRRVLAQVLDYVTHLADKFYAEMPEIPEDANGEPVASRDDILESVMQGDMLVIIASDEIDSRAARLSRTILANNLVKQWDLALLDVALYRPLEQDTDDYLIVPHLRNVVQSELRQVVRVVVEGETPRARVEIHPISHDNNAFSTPRQKWDESRFFKRLKDNGVSDSILQLAVDLQNLARRYPETMSLSWGTGKTGSMTVKRNGYGLVEIYSSGDVRFRPDKFEGALGKEGAEKYLQGLESLVPEAIKMGYPRVSADEVDRISPLLGNLLQQIIEQVENR